jgi:S1-C subfamily serine protease
MKIRVLAVSVVVLAAIAIVAGLKAFSMKAAPPQQEAARQQEQIQTQSKEPDVLDEIMAEQFGEPRSMIGIMGIPGFVIGDVVPGSPADRAGLKRGDILTTVDGEQVNSIKEVLKISRREPGQSVQIVFLRRNPSKNEDDRYETTLITVPFKSPSQR